MRKTNHFRCSKEMASSLLAFFEPFNEFDREEHFEKLFGHIDPNDRQAMGQLLDNEFFHVPWYRNTPVDAKKSLASLLVSALENKDFDFEWLLEEADGTFGLPSSWRINDHRALFEVLYLGVHRNWGDELRASGLILPAPEDLLRMPG